MLGENEPWHPEDHLRTRHPEVRVFDVELPGRLQGCVSHKQGIIWLDANLSAVERRSTLAFEIGQLQQGPTPQDPCMAAAHRRDAAEWAARMLIDPEDLVDAFRRAGGYGEAAHLLGVDVPTLRMRLRGMTDGEQDLVLEAILGMKAVA